MRPSNIRAAPPVGSTWLGPAAKSPALSGVQCPAKMAPAVFARGIHSSGFSTASSKCSGAKRFTRSMPSASEGAVAIRMPPRFTTRSTVARRDILRMRSGRMAATASASAGLSVTSIARSWPLPCSACARRSAATQSGFAVASARMAHSLGPATRSSATVP